MKNIIDNITEKLLEDETIINEKIYGIFFLEKIKYIIMEEITNTDISKLTESFKELRNFKNKLIEIDHEKLPLIFVSKYYEDSLSIIKSSIEKINYQLLLKVLNLYQLLIWRMKKSQNYLIYIKIWVLF